VLKVGSGGAALDLLDRQPNIDLALLDFAMPGMSGVEVARQVQVKYPKIPVLFVTGYADKLEFGDVGEDRIIKKPFIGEELAEKSALLSSRAFYPIAERSLCRLDVDDYRMNIIFACPD
jgi:CheY-like chemotaxis protein